MDPVLLSSTIDERITDLQERYDRTKNVLLLSKMDGLREAKKIVNGEAVY